MTLAVAHRQGEIGVLDAVREIRPPFSPQDVVAEFAALLKDYRVPRGRRRSLRRRMAARAVPQCRHRLPALGAAERGDLPGHVTAAE